MPTTDIQVTDLKINVLTEEQYSQIQSPSNTELYLVPEVVDTVPTENSTNTITSGAVYNAIQGVLPSSTKYGASLELTINSSTFVVTAQLKDQDGNNLGAAQTIDLPLESVVVSGSYDGATKKVVLTLQNGSTVEFSVADLVNGLQSEITAQNPLSADLVVDGTNNKVFTSAEKTKLANIEAGAEVNVQSDWSQTDNTADDFIKNQPPALKDSAIISSIPADGTVIENVVQDYDGNWYDGVVLNNQIWLKENLRVTHNPNGDAITYYHVYNNPLNDETYGLLYNWDTMMDGSVSSNTVPSGVQGIAPDGWHIPSDGEWTQFTTYIGSQSQYICDNNSSYIAKALASTIGWVSSSNDYAVGNNPSTNNATGFSAFPTGSYRENDYYAFGYDAPFWSATESSGFDDSAYRRNLSYKNANVYGTFDYKSYGYSVRCVMDMSASDWFAARLYLKNTSSGFVWSQLSEVAESGSYNDLKDKPTIPSGQVQSDWNQSDSTSVDFIKNKPTLGTAAALDVPAIGNASATQVVKGDDTRLAAKVFSCTYSNNAVDKTPQEIYEAYQAGMLAVCYYNNLTLYLVECDYTNSTYFIRFDSIANANNQFPDLYYLTYAGTSWALSGKKLQQQLVGSGTGQNLKTINNTSLLGSGNIDTSEIFLCSFTGSDDNLSCDKTVQEIYNADSAGKIVFAKKSAGIYFLNSVTTLGWAFFYDIRHAEGNVIDWIFTINSGTSWTKETTIIQPKLIDSGTGQNIKTINNESILGSGNISVNGTFVCTYTNDTMDKTTTEIIQASESGKDVICRDTSTGYVYQLFCAMTGSSQIYFYSLHNTTTFYLYANVGTETWYKGQIETPSSVIIGVSDPYVVSASSTSTEVAYSGNRQYSRYLFEDGCTVFTIDLKTSNFNFDRFLLLDNRNNTSDITITVGTIKQGNVSCANVLKPDPFVIKAGSYVELVYKILYSNNTSTGIVSIVYPDVITTPEPVPAVQDGAIIKDIVEDYDGNKYDGLIMGTQVWMVQNLKTTHDSEGNSVVYYYPNNDSSNKDVYGLLYSWDDMMNGEVSSSENPSGVQGIAPNGWHIPSSSEWDQFLTYVGSKPAYQYDNDSTKIAKALSAKTGWNASSTAGCPGNDMDNNNATGFAVVGAGSYAYGSGVSFNDFTWFHSSTELSASTEQCYNFSKTRATVNSLVNSKSVYSVRCVLDISASEYIDTNKSRIYLKNTSDGIVWTQISKVAETGSYNDLYDKPPYPATIRRWTNGQ